MSSEISQFSLWHTNSVENIIVKTSSQLCERCELTMSEQRDSLITLKPRCRKSAVEKPFMVFGMSERLFAANCSKLCSFTDLSKERSLMHWTDYKRTRSQRLFSAISESLKAAALWLRKESQDFYNFYISHVSVYIMAQSNTSWHHFGKVFWIRPGANVFQIKSLVLPRQSPSDLPAVSKHITFIDMVSTTRLL